MKRLNTYEAESMKFAVNIQGVDPKTLSSTISFEIDNVKYSFPGKILSEHIETMIPPLDDIVKKGLQDGKVVECKLEVVGNGYYLNPWSGEFKLKSPIRVEAHMISNKSKNNISEDDDMPSIEVQSVETSETVVEEELTSESETQQLMKMLEKFMKERLTKEELVTKDELKKGITAHRGKRDVVTEPPAVTPKKMKDKLKYKDAPEDAPEEDEEMNENISEALEDLFGKKPTKKKVAKLKEKLKAKIKKKTINTEAKLKPKKITGDSIRELLRSRGMKSQKAQIAILKRAKAIGGNDLKSVYATLEQLLSPGPVNVNVPQKILMEQYENLLKKQNR